MKIVDLLVERRPFSAAFLAILGGVPLAMFYLGRGWTAIAYIAFEIVGGVAGLAIGIGFDLVGPEPMWAAAIGVVPVRLLGAIQAMRIATSLQCSVPDVWFSRARAVFGLWIAIALAPLLAAIILRMFLAETFEMKSAAMAPTLVQGDRVFVFKRAYDSEAPQVRDIVAYRSKDAITYVRRVVALPGPDTLVVRSELPEAPLETVTRAAVTGKVVATYWSGARTRWQWERPN